VLRNKRISKHDCEVAKKKKKLKSNSKLRDCIIKDEYPLIKMEEIHNETKIIA